MKWLYYFGNTSMKEDTSAPLSGELHGQSLTENHCSFCCDLNFIVWLRAQVLEGAFLRDHTERAAPGQQQRPQCAGDWQYPCNCDSCRKSLACNSSNGTLYPTATVTPCAIGCPPPLFCAPATATANALVTAWSRALCPRGRMRMGGHHCSSLSANPALRRSSTCCSRKAPMYTPGPV